jgi:hypothetical protein
MKHRRLVISAVLLAAAMVGQFAVATATRPRSTKQTKFTVRVENISTPNGQTASDGTKWSFALSPGLWVLHDKKSSLFTEGRAASKGLESQAEDGDPSGLVGLLVMSHHASSMHGVFNTPMGMMGPGPIRPGDSYEFSFTASPGMKLSLTMMNGQSNDEFYAPDEKGIALFDAKGAPISGDSTAKLILWDAGTEVNEELGIGPNQGPRQKAMNTGLNEKGIVTRAKGEAIYTRNRELFRVTVTAAGGGMM